MRLARTLQRYGCDFCKKVGIKSAIGRHEPRCFRNPNRTCDACQDTGTAFQKEDYGYGVVEVEIECPYCLKYKGFLEDTAWQRKVREMTQEEKDALAECDIPF